MSFVDLLFKTKQKLNKKQCSLTKLEKKKTRIIYFFCLGYVTEYWENKALLFSHFVFCFEKKKSTDISIKFFNLAGHITH